MWLRYNPSMSLETLELDQFEGTNYRDPVDELDPSETPRSVNVVLVGNGEGVAMRQGSQEVGKTGDSGWPAAVTGDEGFTNVYIWEKAKGVYTPVLSFNGDIYTKAGINSKAMTQRFSNAQGTNYSWAFEPADDNAGTSFLWCLGHNDTSGAIARKMSTSLVVTTWSGAPPLGRTLKYWRGRMVVGGVLDAINNERLYFSDIGNPESWPASNFVDLRTTGDLADPIMKLEVLGDDLWVFRRHSVWRVTDPTVFTNEKVFDVGVANKYGTCVHKDRIYWVTDRGIYSTDGTELSNESLNLDGTQFGSYTFYPGNFFYSGLGSQPSRQRIDVAPNGRLMWSMGGDGNPYILEGYPDLKGDEGIPWMLHKLPGVARIDSIEAMPPLKFGAADTPSQLFIVGISDNDLNLCLLLMKEDPTNPYSDYDFAAGALRKIVTEYWTPWISVDDIDEYSRVRKIVMLLGARGAVGLEIKVDLYTDWNESTPVATTTISGTGPDRDIMNYWRPESRCRAFALRFYTDAGVSSFKDWELDRAQIKYRGREQDGN